jgi:ribosome-associated translation inhibitor RaiA
MDIGNQDDRILLEKFDILPEDKPIVVGLIEKHIKKIERNIQFDKIKLEMRVHEKGKSRHFEISGHIFSDGKIYSASEHEIDMIKAIARVLERLESETRRKK